ncbi:hypothetical protein [Streptomyces sp. VNUA24]|uniref:hypothetical protein n=1 Tax=Streptomyces sp. VNUA24 TaxID=3031131 RepID=UPI0023B86BA5|nr:hypothetical protein [Streptomyces sp. VNUA24]WEH13140.1 hypothetical protein PYR72_05270 [Streptomyces sp. VNUA24]
MAESPGGEDITLILNLLYGTKRMIHLESVLISLFGALLSIGIQGYQDDRPLGRHRRGSRRRRTRRRGGRTGVRPPGGPAERPHRPHGGQMCPRYEERH